MSTPPRITDPALLERISAYVDGALDPAGMAEIETLATRDAAVLAEIEALQMLDGELGVAFSTLLAAPEAADLPPALRDETPEPELLPLPEPANLDRAPLLSLARIAAAVALLLIGAGAGGLITARYMPPAQVAEAKGWMAEVADYHRVYAAQTRHLVEVPASEKDHIEAWLGKTTGVPFTTPDLSSAGFEFQGARLLVAAGKPVFQLIYTDAEGRVIAICALQGGDAEAIGAFSPRQFGDVHMVSWKSATASYVIVGEAEADLPKLAEIAAQDI